MRPSSQKLTIWLRTVVCKINWQLWSRVAATTRSLGASGWGFKQTSCQRSCWPLLCRSHSRWYYASSSSSNSSGYLLLLMLPRHPVVQQYQQSAFIHPSSAPPVVSSPFWQQQQQPQQQRLQPCLDLQPPQNWSFTSSNLSHLNTSGLSSLLDQDVGPPCQGTSSQLHPPPPETGRTETRTSTSDILAIAVQVLEQDHWHFSQNRSRTFEQDILASAVPVEEDLCTFYLYLAINMLLALRSCYWNMCFSSLIKLVPPEIISPIFK